MQAFFFSCLVFRLFLDLLHEIVGLGRFSFSRGSGGGDLIDGLILWWNHWNRTALSLFDLACRKKVYPLLHERVMLNHIWSLNQDVLLQGTWLTCSDEGGGKLFWHSKSLLDDVSVMAADSLIINQFNIFYWHGKLLLSTHLHAKTTVCVDMYQIKGTCLMAFKSFLIYNSSVKVLHISDLRVHEVECFGGVV